MGVIFRHFKMYKVSLLICLAAMGTFGRVMERQGGPLNSPPPTGMKIPGETEEKYPGLERQGDFDDELSFIGDFVNVRAYGVAGQIYSKGSTMLVIKNFKYNGQAPAGVFWVGTEGSEPSYIG